MNLFQPPDARLHLPRLPLLSDIRNAVLVANRDMDTPTMALSKRTPAKASTSATCSSGTTGDTCQKPTDASATLPIALGVVIPLTAALVAFFFLHRRYKRKLRAEDRADEEKYRSMDFGMDLAYGGGRKKKTKPETNGAGVNASRNMRGLSMEAGSPYLFPGGRGSKESLDTLARETYDADHRYRQVGGFGKGDDMSIRSATPRGRADTSSTLTGPPFDGASNANLLGNAQSFPNSAPRSASLPTPPEPPHGYPTIQEPEKAKMSPLPKNDQSKNSGGLTPTSFNDNTALRQSNNYLRGYIHSREPSVDDDKHSSADSNRFDSNASTAVGSFASRESPKILAPAPAARPSPAEKTPPADSRATFVSMEASIHDANRSSFVQSSNPNSYFGDLNFEESGYKVTPPSPSHSQRSRASKDFRDSASNYANPPPRGQSLAAPMPEIQERRESQHLGELISNLGYNPNRLSVLMRPLPPDDPMENPEERANRIRSFYKEYFDDSKPARQQHAPMPEHAHGFDSHNRQLNSNHLQHGVDYYEDYSTEYMNGGYGVYDKQAQGFVVAAPYAQPITRRAMTPPPRAPPRFQGQTRGRASSGANSYGLPPRGQSSMSNYHSRPGPGSARGSDRGSERGRTPNRKPLPPPAPLISLKTPHLLRDDSALYSAFDLAPPPSYRDRQHGRRPDSPLGTERSYSPAVRAHVPLNSAFDELSPMPSPHLLRKSGTFTALDFAPPTRLRGIDSGSDAGSIRSGKSGMSAAQVYALRSGAHRVSRIPKQLAGSKDDIMQGLKPSWDLRY